MFEFNSNNWAITMHQGDTGSKWIGAVRESGTPWTEDDRCLFTVRNASDAVVMQRIYRLDDQWNQGDGWFLMEFHNADTDQMPIGTYKTEWRFIISPTWSGTAPTSRCVNALAISEKMTDGNVVRMKIQSTLTINGVLGEV